MDEARELNGMINELKIHRLEMQVALYRDVVNQVRKAVPLLAATDSRENALMILSKLCDICEEMEKEVKN